MMKIQEKLNIVFKYLDFDVVTMYEGQIFNEEASINFYTMYGEEKLKIIGNRVFLEKNSNVEVINWVEKMNEELERIDNKNKGKVSVGINIASLVNSNKTWV